MKTTNGVRFLLILALPLLVLVGCNSANVLLQPLPDTALNPFKADFRQDFNKKDEILMQEKSSLETQENGIKIDLNETATKNDNFPFQTKDINYLNYPIIITEKGINSTQAKQLVYSIPEEYYQYVKTIEFTINPAHVTTLDEYGQEKIWIGWSNVYWDRNHQCYNGKIILTQLDGNRLDRDLLIHELGHIYEHCVLKKDISTEEFADNFRIK